MNDPNTTSLMNERTCPDCAETIKLAAKVCKHCGLRFDAKGHGATEAVFSLSAPSDQTTEASTSKPQDYAPDNSTEATPPKLDKILLCAVAALVALLAIGLIFGDFEGQSSTSVASQQDEISNETTAMAMNAMDQAERLVALAERNADASESTADEATPSQALTPASLAKVCRAAIAHAMQKSPSIMKVKANEAGIVRIHYTRPDDGKLWKDDCRVSGNRVIWRAVDAFPGSGAGRWRDTAEDGIMTYRLNGDAVTMKEVFSDGSQATETYLVRG